MINRVIALYIIFSSLNNLINAAFSGFTFRQLTWDNLQLSPSIDDEGPNKFYVADSDRVAVGMGCRGKDCDSMYLITAQLKDLYGEIVQFDHTGLPQNNGTITKKLGYVSSGQNNYYYDAGGLVAVGLAVRGGFSSSVALMTSGPKQDANRVFQRPNVDYDIMENYSIGNTTACVFIPPISSANDDYGSRINYGICPQGKVLSGLKVEGSSAGTVTPICCPFSQAVPIDCQYTSWTPLGSCSLKSNIDGSGANRCGRKNGQITFSRSIKVNSAFGGKNCSTQSQTQIVDCDPCDSNPLTNNLIGYELTSITDPDQATGILEACSYTETNTSCIDPDSLNECSEMPGAKGIMYTQVNFNDPSTCPITSFSSNKQECNLPLCTGSDEQS